MPHTTRKRNRADEERTSVRGVITSYSIHYTKLYDRTLAATVGGLVREGDTLAVITSYSIHYTKLYEKRFMTAMK